MSDPAAEVLVLGLGNLLMGDDGFGPSVIEALNAGFRFPPGVSVLDGGTPGLNLLPLIMDTGRLLVVDTVNTDGKPGELRFYDKSGLFVAPPNRRQSPHEPGLAEVLSTLDLAGRGPFEVFLIGAVPQSTAAGIGLSPPLRAAVPAAVTAIVSWLGRAGSFAGKPVS